MAEPPIVTVKVVRRDGYELLPISGAIGGPSPKGDNIVVNFLIEHSQTPDEYDLVPADEENQLTDPQFPLKIVIRQYQFGAVMSPEQAITIGEWLAQHGRNLIQTRITPNA